MLALSLFSVLLAAPAALGLSLPQLTGCSLSNAKMALPLNQTTLAVPTAPLSFLGLGVGVQNYTCTNGSYVNVGAVAELFDISCLYKAPALFNSASSLAFAAWSKAPASLTAQAAIAQLALSPVPDGVLGQHYFINNTAGGTSPKWDFTSSGTTKNNAEAFVVAAKDATLAAPTGAQDVAWLQLHGVTGELATAVYRVATKGGQPPASCKAGSAPISVKYTSQYWLFGTSLKH